MFSEIDLFISGTVKVRLLISSTNDVRLSTIYLDPKVKFFHFSYKPIMIFMGFCCYHLLYIYSLKIQVKKIIVKNNNKKKTKYWHRIE